MNKLLYISVLVFLLFPVTGYSQELPEGRWYFLDKNDIGILEVTKDSLTNYESSKFEINVSEKLTRGSGFAIMTQNYKDGVHTIVLKPYQTKVTIQKGKVDYSYILVAIDHNPIDNFTGVENKYITLEELNSYKALKNVDEMTEKDFTELATLTINLRETLVNQFSKAGMPFPEYHLYSQMKYKMARLGYNPLISFSELGKKLQKFRSNPNTKQLCNQFIIKPSSDWLEVGVEIDKN